MTPEQREAVWSAWRSGRSQREVGREVGLDHSTVSKIWREQEAWDRRPRRVSIAELCEVAKEHTDERLRVHLTISLLGRQWSPTDIIPPACSILNPHAVTHGVSSNLLRALTDEMAKR